MSRLFVAVWPPASLVARIGAALNRVDAPGVRWVPPERLHVTLRFLGEADEAAAASALARLRAPAVEAVLGPRAGRLGHDAVVLPVDGLDALARAVDAVLVGVGEARERRFLGHLTVARLRARGACGVVDAPVPGRWTVAAVDLVASEQGPDGLRYRTVVTVPLDAGDGSRNQPVTSITT